MPVENKWLRHVRRVQAKHKVSMAHAMQLASKTYRSAGKSPIHKSKSHTRRPTEKRVCGMQNSKTTDRILELGEQGVSLQDINKTLKNEKLLDSKGNPWQTPSSDLKVIARCLAENGTPLIIGKKIGNSHLASLKKIADLAAVGVITEYED